MLRNGSSGGCYINTPDLISIPTFALRTEIPQATLRYWRSLGDASPVTFVRVGKLVRIPTSEIERLIRRNSMGGKRTPTTVNVP